MSVAQAPGLVLPSSLSLPHCEKGIGAVIQNPTSTDLIDGVEVQPHALFPDDRGYFLEVMRLGRGLASKLPAESTQVSSAISYPGTIKAFHYHLRQTDLWSPVMGMLQVALVDLRRDSRTFGTRNTIYVGALRPFIAVISDQRSALRMHLDPVTHCGKAFNKEVLFVQSCFILAVGRHFDSIRSQRLFFFSLGGCPRTFRPPLLWSRPGEPTSYSLRWA